ncbi:hypothetical protein HY493_00130 [Candidatus Woesearchaeota archaeon]|nr:hypothetical protein [Candidatus Woesearchaeota archaeon]
MAVTLVYSPLWFHGIDIILEVFSILAAVLITIVGYKAFKLTRESKYFYFSLAFLLITLSFIARAITTGVVLGQVSGVAIGTDITQAKDTIEDIFSMGRFVYFLFVLFAYVILLALSMRITNKRLVFLLSIFMILFAASAFGVSALVFYLVSLALLSFIAWQYRDNYLARRSSATLLTFIAFALMVLEFIAFIAADWYRPLVVGAYLFRLVAYVILLSMIVRVYTK